MAAGEASCIPENAMRPETTARGKRTDGACPNPGHSLQRGPGHSLGLGKHDGQPARIGDGERLPELLREPARQRGCRRHRNLLAQNRAHGEARSRPTPREHAGRDTFSPAGRAAGRDESAARWPMCPWRDRTWLAGASRSAGAREARQSRSVPRGSGCSDRSALPACPVVRRPGTSGGKRPRRSPRRPVWHGSQEGEQRVPVIRRAIGKADEPRAASQPLPVTEAPHSVSIASRAYLRSHGIGSPLSDITVAEKTTASRVWLHGLAAMSASGGRSRS